MADIDELYSDVFQIPLLSVKRTPVKKKPFLGSAAVKSVDENSVDIYSDMSLDGNSPYKTTPTESNCRLMSEDHLQSLNDNLDLYTEVMTSELTEKTSQELDRLRSENKKLRAENEQLKTSKDQLNKNISSLFFTAKRELKKKEEEIRMLRKLVEKENKIRNDKTGGTDICKVTAVKLPAQNSSHKDGTLHTRKPSCLDKANVASTRGSVENAGSTRDSVVNAGSARDSILNAGSTRDSILNAGSTRDSVVNAGSARDSILNAGSTRDSIVNAGSTRDSIVNAGSTRISIVNAGSTRDSVVNAGSIRDSILNAGSTTDSIVNAGSTRDSIVNAGSTRDIEKNAGSTRDSIVNAGSTRDMEKNAGSTRDSIVNAGSTRDSIVNAGSTRISIVNAGSTRDSVVNAGSIRDSILNAGSTRDSIVNAGSTPDSIVNAGSTRDSIVNAGSTRDSILNAGSTRDSVENAGSTRDSIVNAGSTRDSVENAGSTRNSVENVGSTRDSIENVGSTGDSVENVKVSSLSAAVRSSTSLKLLPTSERKGTFESKRQTGHTDKTLHITDLRKKLLSGQRDIGVKESKSKHEESKKIDEGQITTQPLSQKKNDRTLSLTSDGTKHIEAKENTPNEPILLKSSKVVRASCTKLIDSPSVDPDSRCGTLESKRQTSHTDKTLPVTDLRKKLLSGQRDIGVKESKSKHEESKKIDEGQITTQPPSQKKNDRTLSLASDGTKHIEAKENTPNEPIHLKSSKVVRASCTKLIDSPMVNPDSRCSSQKNAKSQPPHFHLKHSTDTIKYGSVQNHTTTAKLANQTSLDISVENHKSLPANQSEKVQTSHKKEMGDDRDEFFFYSEKFKDTNTDLRQFLKSRKANGQQFENKRSDGRISDIAEPAQNLTNRLHTSKKTVDGCVAQGMKRKNQDNFVEAEVNKTCVESPPLKKNKVAESVELSKGGLNNLVSNTTTNKTVSNTASEKVVSNATANKAVTNDCTNKAVSLEIANKSVSNAASQRVVSNVTVNKTVSRDCANKVVSNAISNKLVSETANKIVSDTANKVVSETANKVVSNATSNKVVSETSNKVVSNATSNRVVSKATSNVYSEPASKVVSNETSINNVWNKNLKRNVSETASKEAPNKADSNQSCTRSASVLNKIDGMNAIFDKSALNAACKQKSVLNSSNKRSSAEDCNKIGAISETSSSSFTNQTWPFQVTPNFHLENSTDASNDTNACIEPKNNTNRAFPIDKEATVLPASPGHQNLSSSFVDIEDVDSEEEADWNDHGNQNCTLIPLVDVKKKRVCTHSGTVLSNRLMDSNSAQPCQLGGSCSEDSQPEFPSHLPFSNLVARKAKVKPDDSNDSEKASSNSSATYTDSDKLSLSGEEFPKKKGTRPLESPVPFATSITCASNLILLGDEETTCTTFVSPCKLPHLPSEFYPPGARAPVQVEASHARHIRGPPEVIQKPRDSLPHKENQASCTLDATKPEGFPSQLDFPSKDSDSIEVSKEQLVDDTRKLNVKANCNPRARKNSGYFTTNTLNPWTSFVEQKFYEIFQKELKTFKEGNVLISQAFSGFDERRKCRLLEKKTDWVTRGQDQGHVSNSVSNSSASSNTAHDKSDAFSNLVPEYKDTVNQTVQQAKSMARDPKAFLSNTGNETSEHVPKTGNITSEPVIKSVKTPNIGPHLVGQARNSPDSWMVTSSDYQNNSKSLSSKLDAGQKPVSTTEEPDSTCEHQNTAIQSTREDDLLRENHHVFEYEENSSDMHLYLSAEDTAEENEFNKSSPSVSPYKASRHIKTSSPIHAGYKNVFSSVVRDDEAVEGLRAHTFLNTTFTLPESNSDSSLGEEGNDLNDPTVDKSFGRLEPPEEISLMEVSLSEFDADVKITPSRKRKSLLAELEASPLSFKNKIALKNESDSPKFVASPFKSHRENSKVVSKKMGCIRTQETSKKVAEAHSIIRVTTNICTGSETIVCSRHKTFQELKANKCVKSQYVFVLTTSDESDEDSTGCGNQARGKTPTESTRAGQMNEEETDFIRTVRRVKKKLDLDSEVASSCGLVNQSPVIHVSDSLTSPPYRQQASEPIHSGKKLTKEPAITLITNFVNCTQIADNEDVEEGEILESSLENEKNESGVKDKSSMKADSHKAWDRKYSQVTEERKAVSKKSQVSKSSKQSGPDYIKIRNDGSRNGQVSKSEISFDKSSWIESRLTGNQLSSSSKHSMPTTERIDESNRIRKRSRSPVRDHKYDRNDSGQRLSLEKSDNKGPRHERDTRREERISREYQEADLQYSQEGRKYSEQDMDRKYQTPRDANYDKDPSKENKHRSSSRHR